jgi:6-phosphogluconate dehydrogenase
MASLIGVVGLGVMGSSLALNMERHGFPVAVYNRDVAKTHALIQGAAAGKAIVGTERPEEFVSALERPRRILLMVKAGAAVDSVIALFAPLLAPGDILMDGGNSFFLDTDRRSRELEAAGFNFLGIGVSGGEEGALWGPSLMPGGQREAWEAVAPVFRAIAARAEDGEPCVAHIGPRGAGHYVKMVHNGIEYGDMQLIAESYDLLHRGLGLSAGELADLFAEWNGGDLKSYLVEITATILRRRDEETGRPLVELVLDEAQQKGTGKWTSQNALDVGAPVHTINAAVESRIISALKSQRVEASRLLRGPRKGFRGNRARLIGAARDALYASKILSYAQGFGLLSMASAEYGYELHLAEIARIWRAGCIIRAALLNDIAAAYRRKPALANLLLDRAIRTAVNRRQAALRLAVRTAVDLGIPLPAHMASLAYFDAYRSECLPANLTQAQRDHFGAHTYRRLDREGVFHTDWGR